MQPSFSKPGDGMRRGRWLCCLLLTSLLWSPAGGASPPNDDFADRLVLEGLDVTTTGSNLDASAELGEPAHAGLPAGQSVWWSWEAPYDGLLRIGVTNVDAFYMHWALYVGESLDNLVVVATSEPSIQSIVDVPVHIGTVYQLAVDAGSSAPASLTVALSLRTLAILEPVAEARLTAGLPVSVVVQDSADGWGTTQVELWADGVLVASTTQPPYTLIWQPSGLGPSQITAVATNASGERRESPPVSVVVTSPNDDFSSRLFLSGLTNRIECDNTLATVEPGEPGVGDPMVCGAPGKTLWWSYVAPEAGVLSVSAGGLQYGVYCAVYRGEALDDLELLAHSCNQLTYMPVLAGEVLQIQADGVNDQHGVFWLETVLHTPPTNDAFERAAQHEEATFVAHGNNTAASFEPGEVVPLEDAGGRTVWYSWVAPQAGRAHFSSGSTHFFRALAVYTGDTLGHLQRVVGGQDYVTFIVDEGSLYHLQVDGRSDGFGDFWMRVELQPCTPPTNDDFVDASVFTGAHGRDAAWITTATVEPGEPAHLDGARGKSLWWRWQAPRNGMMGIMSEGSSISSLTFAVYTGETVEALTLVDKRQGSLFLESIQGGTTYAIAAVVEADARGDVAINLVSGNAPFGAPPSYEVPGNILCESSFEGTDMDLRCWHAAGIGYNGAIGQSDGADGTTWVIVNTGGGLWQEVPTQPGLSYHIKFAFRPEFGVTSGKAVAKWDNLELGFALSPPEDEVYWHWAEFTATATSELSRFSVEVVEGVLGLDAFSIVPLSAPPVILTQPNSASTFAGGSVSLLVGSSGSPPLSYQWFHEGTALENETNKVLTLSPVTASDAGSYYVLVSNPHGTATSEAAVLVVEQLGTPTIVLQPYGDRIPEGASYTLSVAAVGTPPLFYQWLYNGNDLPGATERHYLLESVQQTNAGVYSVRVWNSAAETVWSLPATLWVDTNAVGGGALHFINELPEWDITRQMWIYDTDGFTKLRGTNFAAQLYAGPTLDSIRALGPPRPFLTGFYAGLFDPVKLVLPTVPWPGEAFVQVRVWETSFGSRYEEARALGGKFGSSEILRIQVGLLPEPPPLWGLKSFSLQAGRPEFTVGRVDLAERHADGSVTWSVTGEAGYLYLIEKQLGDAVWRPLLVVTNETGVSQFRDPSATSENLNLYRARILD